MRRLFAASRVFVSDALYIVAVVPAIPFLLVFLSIAWMAEKIAGSDADFCCQCALCVPGFQLFRFPRKSSTRPTSEPSVQRQEGEGNG